MYNCQRNMAIDDAMVLYRGFKAQVKVFMPYNIIVHYIAEPYYCYFCHIFGILALYNQRRCDTIQWDKFQVHGCVFFTSELTSTQNFSLENIFYPCDQGSR